jgi:hypothetical protein
MNRQELEEAISDDKKVARLALEKSVKKAFLYTLGIYPDSIDTTSILRSWICNYYKCTLDGIVIWCPEYDDELFLSPFQRRRGKGLGRWNKYPLNRLSDIILDEREEKA